MPIDQCDFPRNHPHRVNSFEQRTCRRCGRTVKARLFPVRARCSAKRVFGLGDIVAWLIKRVSFGRVVQKPGCGCAKRQETLNRWWSWWKTKPPGE